jgi:iron complex outermembrane receptor protein
VNKKLQTAGQVFALSCLYVSVMNAAVAEEPAARDVPATSSIILAAPAIQVELPAENMLPAVTVTSTTIDDRFDSKRGEASNVSNISGKQVDGEHGKNIMDILDAIPGVTAEIQSGDSVKIMLRGVEAQRYMGEKPGVAVVIDGVPVLERTGRVNIDLDNIESIKVIKGGASYLFGEDALSGAIIITTKRGAKMAGYTVSTEMGSFGYRKALARAGFAEGNWVGHLQASKAYADDFYDQGAYSRRYVDGKLQYLIDATSDISLGFENAKRAKDSHGTVTGMSNAILDPRSVNGGKDFARKYSIDLNKLNATYAKDFGDATNLLITSYLYQDHTYGWQNPSGFVRAGAGCTGANVSAVAACNMTNLRDVYATGRDTQQTQKGVKGELRQGGDVVGLMGGLDLQQFEDLTLTKNLVSYSARGTAINAVNPLNTVGGVAEDSRSTTATKAIYGEAKWQVNQPLSLTMNGRYDHLAIGFKSNTPLTAAQLATGKVAAGNKNFAVLSERLGLNYAVSEVTEFYSNLSNGFRAPTAAQLYGSTITPTGAIAANPNLQPEKAWNKELGVRAKRELLGLPLDLDFALFQIDRKDFILNTGGQYQTTPAANGIEQYQNIGGVRNRGLEAALKTDAKADWSANVAYTYLDSRYTRYNDYWMTMGPRNAPLPSVHYNNTGKVVPRSSKHKLNIGSKYRVTDAFSVGAEANAQSGSFADDVNVVWVGGRTVYNLMANYDIKQANNYKVSFFARLDNLFNRFYLNSIRGSSDSNGDGVYNQNDPSIIVNPGRVWTVGLSATF